MAEYLSSGYFGHRIFENTKQKQEDFAHCGSAWKVADALVMDDLLYYVVEKMEMVRPWGLVETLAFAKEVYNTVDAPLPAYKKMKDALSELVADNYLEYLSDYPELFGQRMIKLPEFLNDVHRVRVKKLEEMRQESQGYDPAVEIEGGQTDEVDLAHEAFDLDEQQEERERD